MDANRRLLDIAVAHFLLLVEIFQRILNRLAPLGNFRCSIAGSLDDVSVGFGTFDRLKPLLNLPLAGDALNKIAYAIAPALRPASEMKAIIVGSTPNKLPPA